MTGRRSIERWSPACMDGRLGHGYVCPACPRHDHRTTPGGILWVLHTAVPWRNLPDRLLAAMALLDRADPTTPPETVDALRYPIDASVTGPCEQRCRR